MEQAGGSLGGRLLSEVAERSGLEGKFSKTLAPLAQRRRHDPGRVLMDLAVTLADGGECIADLATLRQQPDLFGQVASTPTAWRVLDEIQEPLLERREAARATARARVSSWGMAPMRLTAGLRLDAGGGGVGAQGGSRSELEARLRLSPLAGLPG